MSWNLKRLNRSSFYKTLAFLLSICLVALFCAIYGKVQVSASENLNLDDEANVFIAWNPSNINLLRSTNSASVAKKTLDFSKVSVDTSNKKYTSYQVRPRVSANGLKANCDYAVSYGKNIATGTGTVTVRGIGNYTGSKTYSFKINKAILYVSWDNLELTYNAQEQVPVVTVSGILGTDKVTPRVSGAKKYPGQGYLACVNIDNNNYVLNGAISNLYNINKAPLTLEWGQTTFKCNGYAQAPTAKVNGLFGEDTLDVTVEGAQIDVNSEPYTARAYVKSDLYEIAGDNTVQFTIEKGDPTYTPGTLIGEFNKELSTVKLPEPSMLDTPGSVVWNDDETVMGAEGEQIYYATFTPNDTSNYNTLTNLPIKVNVKKTLTVTFNASVPAKGYTFSMDDKRTNKIEKTLTCDDGTVTNAVHTLTISDFPTVKITSSNPGGYYFAGWATSQNAESGTKVYDMIGKTASDHAQYYAVWAKAEGFWLGTAGADANYSNEYNFTRFDSNYHSAVEIMEDMDVLHNPTDPAFASVKAKWDGYYNNSDSSDAGVGNRVRLYATYEGGENEGSLDCRFGSDENKYVEFRILQVGEHDSDGSVVTFMATHLLPTGYSMNSSDSNVGGWGESTLKEEMNNGEICWKFSNDFVSQVKSVNKVYGTGDKTVNTASASCKFWVLSKSELTGSCDFVSEGSQYDWCLSQGITNADIEYSPWNNSKLANWKTRAGNAPGCTVNSSATWWLRSAHTNPGHYMIVNPDGGVDYNHDLATSCWGVAPAFAF